MNATAVIGLLYTAGFDLDLVREHLNTFGGVKRRFTEKIVNDTVIIDDFAHHPTEIIATLDAARQKYPSKEIVAISNRILLLVQLLCWMILHKP